MALDARHALYTGWIAGLAMRQGLKLIPVVDRNGYYTDLLELELDHASTTVFVVVPYPPHDWELPE